ncbi:aldose 1-epimerase family protein [Desertivibrio insolitus]|uniref:aldose 1-epimerase family protein n=1 Tax=Herbiconiux sp. SYSU D00978 TaxID=2812562 RepID=UPI001A95CEEC|nr:aldose 1-epimerase family protein [Herbiconiux sp. SYSU D00978]
MTALTGEQFELTRGNVRAIVSQVGAALRTLQVGGVDVIEPHPETSTPPFGNGTVLVPWPNRVRDGKWQLDGIDQQLVLTEPARLNALHGLLTYAPYTQVERTESSVTLAATIYPQAGWPFLLDTTVTYELTDDGIRVTHGASNPGDVEAPFAVGTHPFFRIGDVRTEDLTLTVLADSVIEVDERLNPTGEVPPVDGTKYDLREGRRLGGVILDTAFADVHAEDGATAWLEAPDGRRVSLLQDPTEWPWMQVFTTRLWPRHDGRGLAVAIEPMTAPPNALVSGLGLRWLRTGDSWSGSWGVRYSA